MPEMPELTWEKTTVIPPRQSKRAARQKMYLEVAAAAKSSPGDVIVIRGYSTQATATNMRKGRYPAINPDEFEIETRKNPDGIRYDVYLRYIGQ